MINRKRTSINDHFQTSWRHIRRSPYQALAAVSIMVLMFFITSVFVLLAAGSEIVLRYFETRPQVTAFLEDETTSEEREALILKLNKTGKVSEIKYVSKEEALLIYQEQNKDDPLLLEMVTANILPASLEISMKDLSYLGGVVDLLNQEPGIEEVDFQKQVVESLRTWTNNLRIFGLILVGFLGMVSFLIILVVIGMKVALRRKEIKILQLLGASYWYIRVPFLLEGIIYGVFGSFFAWLLASLILFYSTPFLVDFLSGIPVLPVSALFLLGLLGGEVILGMIIGVLGSFVAVRRYLR
ncbi:cell division protein FtsX [Patescibacteria group bacterium]